MTNGMPGPAMAPEILYCEKIDLIVPSLWMPTKIKFWATTEQLGSVSGGAPHVLKWAEHQVWTMILGLDSRYVGLFWKEAFVRVHGTPVLKISVEKYYYHHFSSLSPGGRANELSLD